MVTVCMFGLSLDLNLESSHGSLITLSSEYNNRPIDRDSIDNCMRKYAYT